MEFCSEALTGGPVGQAKVREHFLSTYVGEKASDWCTKARLSHKAAGRKVKGNTQDCSIAGVYLAMLRQIAFEVLNSWFLLRLVGAEKL
jgi:hypothetical protein